MNKPVISVRGLGKKYHLGATLRSDTMRDMLANSFKSLVHRGRRNNVGHDSPGAKTKAGGTSDFWALKDVSFDVQQGEVIGIIGYNGAGKSTLLKVLSEITEPTTGEIRIRGRVASLLEVGTGFHPELSGRENIYLNGAILGMSRKEITRKFDEIVAFSEVEKFIDTPVKRYSSGMYVRLAFAVAAHLEPEILMVDEVLAVGDVRFQKKCLGKMDQVSHSGRTIFFVSHNMAAVESLCSKTLLLRKGELITFGPTMEVIADYLTTSYELQSGTSQQSAGKFIRDENKDGLIREACFLNSNGEETNQVRLGDACEFQVLLESDRLYPEIAFGIHIMDEARKRITSFHTKYHQSSPVNLDGHLKLACKCPELMLVPGKYTVELAVASVGHVEDRVDYAFSFCVLDSNLLGTGKVPALKDGVLVSKGYWDH